MTSYRRVSIPTTVPERQLGRVDRRQPGAAGRIAGTGARSLDASDDDARAAGPVQGYKTEAQSEPKQAELGRGGYVPTTRLFDAMYLEDESVGLL